MTSSQCPLSRYQLLIGPPKHHRSDIRRVPKNGAEQQFVREANDTGTGSDECLLRQARRGLYYLSVLFVLDDDLGSM